MNGNQTILGGSTGYDFEFDRTPIGMTSLTTDQAAGQIRGLLATGGLILLALFVVVLIFRR